MTLKIDMGIGVATPFDDVKTHETYTFKEVVDLPQLIQERIALLRLSDINIIVDGVGINMGNNIFIVCEM